jgi:hypothetical protein
MVNRVLMLVNRSAGTGSRPGLVEDLLAELRRTVGRPEELEAEVVDDHPAARLATKHFLDASPLPAVVIVGGGGGTLRAAVEGVCDSGAGRMPAADRVRLAALRLGSGNVVARRFGVPADPMAAVREIATSLDSGRTAPCAVMRCRFGTKAGAQDVRHAVTMCGLGQFGRTPGDLVRWHRMLARSRHALVSAVGIERLNNLEYMASAGGRLLGAALYPPACERVEVKIGGRTERYRLLAGAVMNFGISAVPIDPGVGIGEAAAGVTLLPWMGRPRARHLRAGESLAITLLDRDSVEFFLDEDPERAFGRLTIEVAGTVAFVPGALYRVAS